MDPQTAANQSGRKVYAYRMDDFSVDHSYKYLCVGDTLNGRKVIELLGAYIPQKSTAG